MGRLGRCITAGRTMSLGETLRNKHLMPLPVFSLPRAYVPSQLPGTTPHFCCGPPSPQQPYAKINSSVCCLECNVLLQHQEITNKHGNTREMITDKRQICEGPALTEPARQRGTFNTTTVKVTSQETPSFSPQDY